MSRRLHLGSPSAIISSTGTLVVNENFAAYGTRRNPATWSGAPSSGDLTTIAGITRQGYTGQTMLGNMGLIHMNGRVQDTVTGRFLSADPYISNPGFTQGFNRYAYVNNNPLTFIDPSGFEADKEVSCNGCKKSEGFGPFNMNPNYFADTTASYYFGGSSSGAQVGDGLTLYRFRPGQTPSPSLGMQWWSTTTSIFSNGSIEKGNSYYFFSVGSGSFFSQNSSTGTSIGGESPGSNGHGRGAGTGSTGTGSARAQSPTPANPYTCAKTGAGCSTLPPPPPPQSCPNVGSNFTSAMTLGFLVGVAVFAPLVALETEPWILGAYDGAKIGGSLGVASGAAAASFCNMSNPLVNE